uniref:Protein nucleotidyltransferase YdiU n=1 Tax=Gloeobacter violaceus (strain ATCC 29082 / PCC 7421) TaxID=251221 RepID=SELO_GLOVI|nr:RecName: Full=Protein adenylyltransferase SelO [Gloeobacter violaceus PCC 7421]
MEGGLDTDASVHNNPLLQLDYEPAFASLGDDYYDLVAAAPFPEHRLRFRGDGVLRLLGLDPATVGEEHFIEAFGRFAGRGPFLAMRYHGYQFGEYNPYLGDGRGFLYGQVRGLDGELYDFGTKGSGTTPYSRGGDGRLTLKGGVREVLASEALHHLGVRTSRSLSLIETGEALWRGDEPSPTRSAVLVRTSRSHVRFGTFERLHHFKRKDLIQKLLDYVIAVYYPHYGAEPERYALFYRELVGRTAELAAQWMAVGFTHAVLNTDNMSITAESFDYGPYAFIDRFDPGFTAAYFDHYGRYSYGNQPLVCRINLEALQLPLSMVIPIADLEAGLAIFDTHYAAHYTARMLAKLGFGALGPVLGPELVKATLNYLEAAQAGYHGFFQALAASFDRSWQSDQGAIPAPVVGAPEAFELWRESYFRALASLSDSELLRVGERLNRHNPTTVLLRPAIEAVWAAIDQNDDWQPFYDLIGRLRKPYAIA